MDNISELFLVVIDFLSNLESYLLVWHAKYGEWLYLIVFLMIFCETGVVIMPFLPGDSLLFLLGTLAGAGILDIYLVCISVFLGCLVGDSTNYFIGRTFGRELLRRDLFVKAKHVEKTRAFFDKHGGKTFLFGRFLPILRTYIPFVGGLSAMSYKKFLLYNLAGALIWVTVVPPMGYFLGKIEWVSNNLTKIFLALFIGSGIILGSMYVIRLIVASKKAST